MINQYTPTQCSQYLSEGLEVGVFMSSSVVPLVHECPHVSKIKRCVCSKVSQVGYCHENSGCFPFPFIP